MLAQYIEQVVEIEQPVHTDEVAKRVARAWGAQRTGARIRNSVAKALAAAKAQGRLSGDPFWMVSGGTVRVRDRSGVMSSTLRQTEFLPPLEVDCAVLEAISRSVAIGNDEIAPIVAEAFGFSATSAQLRALVDERLAYLLANTRIAQQGGLLRVQN